MSVINNIMYGKSEVRVKGKVRIESEIAKALGKILDRDEKKKRWF